MHGQQQCWPHRRTAGRPPTLEHPAEHMVRSLSHNARRSPTARAARCFFTGAAVGVTRPPALSAPLIRAAADSLSSPGRERHIRVERMRDSLSALACLRCLPTQPLAARGCRAAAAARTHSTPRDPLVLRGPPPCGRRTSQRFLPGRSTPAPAAPLFTPCGEFSAQTPPPPPARRPAGDREGPPGAAICPSQRGRGRLPFPCGELRGPGIREGTRGAVSAALKQQGVGEALSFAYLVFSLRCRLERTSRYRPALKANGARAAESQRAGAAGLLLSSALWSPRPVHINNHIPSER